MELLGTLFGFLWGILSFILGIIWWILSFLFFPLFVLGIIAVFALRFAYQTPLLKPYVERLFSRLGEKGLHGARSLLQLLTLYPLQLLIRYIWFSIWREVVYLFWRPKWTAWERARRRSQKQNS